MQTVKIQLNRLPIGLELFSNGCIAFHRIADFTTIIDNPEEGVSAIISNDDIKIGAIAIKYGEVCVYKNMPELLEWLQAQKMIMPNFKGI